MAQAKSCSPTCQSFKCGKNVAIFRRDSVWCRDGDEPCNVAKCTYSMCFKRRLLPGAICGETVRRQTSEHDLDDDFYKDEDKSSASVKLKGKALRKLGDQDYY
ncbi:MAG: hypothetical protein LBH79_05340 [Nitrososphaerota archaeon]|nr:hypothetical protein [Nitrososphaerota archaeon]